MNTIERDYSICQALLYHHESAGSIVPEQLASLSEGLLARMLEDHTDEGELALEQQIAST